MQSRTSFFNRSVFGKSVRRFWPVWGAHFAISLLLVPVLLLASRARYMYHPDELRQDLLNLGYYGGIIMGAVFGVFSAMSVWSFAYSARSCHGMACLPLRRETVFLSQVLAGLVPYAGSMLAVAVLAIPVQAGIGTVDLGATVQWLLLNLLPFLLFYGFATFCAQLTGNILVLPAVYAVLNFVVVGAEVLIRGIVGVFVYGMHTDVDNLNLTVFSPVMGYLVRSGVYEDFYMDGDMYVSLGYKIQDWRIYIIYAVAGLAFLALSLLLYRRRRMETAGDVVAVNVLKPVFRWCMAIGSGLLLSTLCYLIFWDFGGLTETGTALFVTVLLTTLLGAVIGWLAAEMLIKKSFRVFRNGSWGKLGICCLVIAALLCACEFDFFGYERYVPQTDRVEQVSLRVGGGSAAVLSRPESVAEVTALHESVISHKYENEHTDCYAEGQTAAWLTLEYTLKNGRVVSREYLLSCPVDAAEGSDLWKAQEVLNCSEAIDSRKATSFPITEANYLNSDITTVMTGAQCAKAAGYADAEEYILREYCGGTDNFRNEEERQLAVADAVRSYALNGWEKDGAAPAPEDALFNYSFHFTAKQMMELYETCILPDMADGTLGRAWIIWDDSYLSSVYETSISISAEQAINSTYQSESGEGAEGDCAYSYFSVETTVDSVRTNTWLAAHGVPQMTVGEVENQRTYG